MGGVDAVKLLADRFTELDREVNWCRRVEKSGELVIPLGVTGLGGLWTCKNGSEEMTGLTARAEGGDSDPLPKSNR